MMTIKKERKTQNIRWKDKIMERILIKRRQRREIKDTKGKSGKIQKARELVGGCGGIRNGAMTSL